MSEHGPEIIKVKKGSSLQVGKYFQAWEFDCPCEKCKFTLISIDLVKGLDQMRKELGTHLVVSSGYRCDAHQKWLKESGYPTAVGRSQHQDGKAADVCSDGRSGSDLEVVAAMAGFLSIGVGHDYVHVDTRFSKKRRWVYP